IGTYGIGTSLQPINTKVANVQATSFFGNGIYLNNQGDVTVGGLTTLFHGLQAVYGSVYLQNAGAVTLVDTVSAPQTVTFNAGSLVQAGAADEVDAGNLQIHLSAGNLGSGAVPFTFKAGTLSLSTDPSVNNAAQYLQAIGSVNVYPTLDNASGTTWLMGGTFVDSGLINAR